MSGESQADSYSAETRRSVCCLITPDLVVYMQHCRPHPAQDNEALSSAIPVLPPALVEEDDFSILEISIQHLTDTQNSNKQK